MPLLGIRGVQPRGSGRTWAPRAPVRVGISVRPRLCRYVSPRTPARTRPTAATGTPSASTWATSATPCTSVSARRATRATGSSAGRTQTWTAGPTRTWCAPPTPPTTASRCGRPAACPPGCRRDWGGGKLRATHRHPPKTCAHPGCRRDWGGGQETPGHPPAPPPRHLPRGFLQIPGVVLGNCWNWWGTEHLIHVYRLNSERVEASEWGDGWYWPSAPGIPLQWL